MIPLLPILSESLKFECMYVEKDNEIHATCLFQLTLQFYAIVLTPLKHSIKIIQVFIVMIISIYLSLSKRIVRLINQLLTKLVC